MKVASSQWFSVAVDESAVLGDRTELALVPGIDVVFTITEELADEERYRYRCIFI